MPRNGMLLFINVALALCLGVSISSFMAAPDFPLQPQSSCQRAPHVSGELRHEMCALPAMLGSELARWLDCTAGSANVATPFKYPVVVFVFLIYLANILRTFLGFVAFYDSQLLYCVPYTTAFGGPRARYVYRIVDFLFMFTIVLTMIFQAFFIASREPFYVFLIACSILFVLRNAILLVCFWHAKATLHGTTDSALSRVPYFATAIHASRGWLILDAIILLLAGLGYAGFLGTGSHNELILGGVGILILLVELADIWWFRVVYFEPPQATGGV